MQILFPGSFDPPHLGHIDLIRRLASLADALVVGIATNPAKTPFLPSEVRQRLIRASCPDLANLRVLVYAGQTVAFARSLGIGVLARGLRHGGDLEREQGMAAVNRRSGGMETLFLPADGACAHLSSSLVREAHGAGMGLEGLVPIPVAEAMADLGSPRRPAP